MAACSFVERLIEHLVATPDCKLLACSETGAWRLLSFARASCRFAIRVRGISASGSDGFQIIADLSAYELRWVALNRAGGFCAMLLWPTWQTWQVLLSKAKSSPGSSRRRH